MKKGNTVFHNNPDSSTHGEEFTVNEVGETRAHVTCNRWPRLFGWWPFSELSETPPAEPGEYENIIEKMRRNQ
jgi:hypothetical protein